MRSTELDTRQYDHLGHSVLHERVEYLDEKDEAGAEDEERDDEEDQAHDDVRQIDSRAEVTTRVVLIKASVLCGLQRRVFVSWTSRRSARCDK